MARVAVVTGGMGGLGEAICIKLAALGDPIQKKELSFQVADAISWWRPPSRIA